MKKIYYILAVLFLALGAVKAQQLPLYSQYVNNQYLVNPAVVGTVPYYEVKTSSRYQWVGMTDAPRTHIISLHGPVKGKNFGVGGSLFTDITGPTRRNGFQLSYAYHVKFSDEMKLSLGLSGGLLQYTVDGGKINLTDNNDVALSNGLQSTLVPDFGFGAYFFTPKYYVGISAPQLVHSKLKFFDYTKKTLSKLSAHYYLIGGYKIDISDNIVIEPNLLVKYGPPAPVQLDLGVRGIFKNMVWLGGSFRTKDAVSVMAGYIYQENISIGYSYDLSISNLRRYNNGTHEVMLGIRFNKGFLLGEKKVTVE